MKNKIDQFINYLESYLDIYQKTDYHIGMVDSQRYILNHLKQSRSIEFTHEEILKLRDKLKSVDINIVTKTHKRAGNYCGLCMFNKFFSEYVEVL